MNLKTTIIPTNARNEILHTILNDSTSIIVGDKLCSIDTFFQDFFKFEKKSLIIERLELHQQLTSLPKTNLFYKLIHQQDFVAQVHRVLRELKRYAVNYDLIADYPTRELFAHCSVVEFYEDIILKYLDNKELNFNNVMILEGNYDYFVDKVIFPILIQYGAKMISLKQFAEIYNLKSYYTESNQCIYECDNPHQEVEVIANEIIEKRLDPNLIKVYYSNPSYETIIKEVFTRYKLPFNINFSREYSFVSEVFNTVFEICKNKKGYEELIYRYNILNLGYSSDKQYNELQIIRQYYNQFQTFDDLTHLQSIDQLNSTFSLLYGKNAEKEIEKLKSLEIKVQNIFEEYHDNIQLLKSYDLKQLIELVYNHLAKQNLSSIDVKVLNSINQYIEIIFPYMDDDFACEYLHQLIKNETTNQLLVGGITVVPTKNNVPFKKYCYYVGCNAESFIHLPTIDGLFSQSMNKMWDNIKNYYPSVSLRYKFNVDATLNFDDASEIVYCYPSVSLEGKQQQLDANIPAGEITEKKVHHSKEKYQCEFVLTPTISQQLFFNNNVELITSVSKTELYFNSPFSYFLQYGLKIKPIMDKGFTPMIKGNIYHYLLEKYVKLYGKNYAQKGVSLVQNDLQSIFSIMQQLLLNRYINDFKIDEKQIYFKMKKALINLIQFETSDERVNFMPLQVNNEYVNEINYYLNLEKYTGKNIILSGKIDRIDRLQLDNGEDVVDIIDYKSTSKLFSQAKFKRGVDLQIATYIFATKQLIKNALFPFNVEDKAVSIYQASYLGLSNKLSMNSIKLIDDLLTCEINKSQAVVDLLQRVVEIYISMYDNLYNGNIQNEIDVDFKYYNYNQLFGEVITKKIDILRKGDQ